jgi:DNA repair exonuclease SbcCD ATPase subunit
MSLVIDLTQKKIEELELSLGAAQEEAKKVQVLETQLEDLKTSSAEDKKNALESLETDLNQKHKQVLDELNEKQAEELKQLTDRNSALDARLHEELRIMKEQMTASHEAESARVVEEALVELRGQHANEMAEVVAQHREKLDKASEDMKVLARAHGEKTSALETAISEAKAALQAEEEKSKRIPELQAAVDSKQKELDTATTALQDIQSHLKQLESQHHALAENVTKSVPRPE